MASLVVELGRGVPLGGLRDVLARALGDPSLQVASAPSSGYVDAAGHPVDLPVGDPTRTVTRLEHGDELLGVLVHDPLIEVEDPGLVEAVGTRLGSRSRNERLAAEVRAQLEEVRASRVRIVEAADAERRRVERDLHDGAQQRLVALAMRLQVAKQSTPEASGLLDAATTELETAIGEVRGLARGVHPTILTESGLAAAVDMLAERTTVRCRRRRRQPFPCHRRSDRILRRGRGADERGALFEAGGARVTVRETGDTLLVEVATTVAAAPTGGRHGPSRTRRSRRCHRRSADGHESGWRRDNHPRRAPGPCVGEAATPATDGLLDDGARGLDPSAFGGARRAASMPTRIGAVSPVVLILALTGGLTVLAVGAGVLGSQSNPVDGRAEAFARPFVFQIPSDIQIVVDAKSEDLHVLSALRTGQGISIWSVGDVVVDNCSWEPDSPTTSRQPGVDGLLTYLWSVPRLRVEDLGTLTLDGRPRPSRRPDRRGSGHAMRGRRASSCGERRGWCKARVRRSGYRCPTRVMSC